MIDPGTLSVLWGGFRDVAATMGSALRTSAYSIAVRDGDDFSTAFFDPDGRLVAQGEFSPGHLGAMPFVVRHVVALHHDDAEEGDAFVINDPYAGSGHLPDVFLVSPVFVEGTLIGWLANGTHHSDMGGYAVGSQAVMGVSELYQEGLVLPCTRLYVRGEVSRDVLGIVLANVRTPDLVRGDLAAQHNANEAGAERVRALAARHGTEATIAAMAQVISGTEIAIRERIAALPDGVYRFETELEDWGSDTPPIAVVVTATIDGETVTVDFTGSGASVPAGINCALNYTMAYTLCAFKALVAPEMPQNEGTIAPLNVVAPLGSYFNPAPPAAVGGRQLAAPRIFEAVTGALSQAAPRGGVAGFGDMANPIISGRREDGSRYVFYDLVIGSLGGHPEAAGTDGLVGPHNPSNIPVEVQEASAPIRVERFELVDGTGGRGSHDGGRAVRRELRLLQGENVSITLLAERARRGAKGLFGGGDGSPGEYDIVRADGTVEPLHSKGRAVLAAGDLVRIQTPGAGGWGEVAGDE
ncbi:hydantoinase B/oxoprolinase family protein [Nocardioides sp. R-C-SC26]|uniref:hydantoinase B/oxoprolinase family protein n=1 Tax=Nocardioides sp. R-C-SC26 TaxID=2870414 RepID=UPI001E4D7632|nr:hydantoinase B/oxoprolinase family protein [Nocardioides sp. R-C-SC26]